MLSGLGIPLMSRGKIEAALDENEFQKRLRIRPFSRFNR